MGDVSGFLLATTVAYGYSLVVWPLLKWLSKVEWPACVVVSSAVLCSPLLISNESVRLRALVSVLCIDQTFKMIDYSRQFRQRGDEEFRFIDYVRFLIPFPVLMVVFDQHSGRVAGRSFEVRNLIGLVVFALLFASGFLMVDWASSSATLRSSFPLDHLTKFSIFVVTIESLSAALYHLERLVGYDTSPIIQQAYRSQTVAEFWCRYNQRVHDWFRANVFRPSGGRRLPVRGVLTCFFVSGVFHELMFGIATSRIDGYQFAFFMLQAPAVLISPRINAFALRHGIGGSVIAHATTIGWMLITSTLFFHGVNRVFPFLYTSQPWLP